MDKELSLRKCLYRIEPSYDVIKKAHLENFSLEDNKGQSKHLHIIYFLASHQGMLIAPKVLAEEVGYSTSEEGWKDRLKAVVYSSRKYLRKVQNIDYYKYLYKIFYTKNPGMYMFDRSFDSNEARLPVNRVPIVDLAPVEMRPMVKHFLEVEASLDSSRELAQRMVTDEFVLFIPLALRYPNSLSIESIMQGYDVNLPRKRIYNASSEIRAKMRDQNFGYSLKGYKAEGTYFYRIVNN